MDIVLASSSLFDEGATVRALLSDFQIDSEIVGVEDITRDTMFLGLYRDASDVAQYLEIAGIRLDVTLRTPFTPAIDRKGTAFMLLHEGPDRHVLAILGDTKAAVADMVGRLGSGSFRDGLLGDFVGVYRSP